MRVHSPSKTGVYALRDALRRHAGGGRARVDPGFRHSASQDARDRAYGSSGLRLLNRHDQLARAIGGPVLDAVGLDQERILGVVPHAVVIIAVLDADHGVRLEHGLVDLVHARLLVRVKPQPVTDEFARKIVQVFADEAITTLEAFTAGEARLQPKAEFELHLVETRPDVLLPVARLPDEVGAHEVARVAAVARAHVAL